MQEWHYGIMKILEIAALLVGRWTSSSQSWNRRNILLCSGYLSSASRRDGYDSKRTCFEFKGVLLHLCLSRIAVDFIEATGAGRVVAVKKEQEERESKKTVVWFGSPERKNPFKDWIVFNSLRTAILRLWEDSIHRVYRQYCPVVSRLATRLGSALVVEE